MKKTVSVPLRFVEVKNSTWWQTIRQLKQEIKHISGCYKLAVTTQKPILERITGKNEIT